MTKAVTGGIRFKMCFGCSIEPSHKMVIIGNHNLFWLKNKKVKFQLHILIMGSAITETYPCKMNPGT